MALSRDRRPFRRWPSLVAAGVLAASGLLALIALLTRWSASATLPVGQLGRVVLSVDPVSAVFLTLFLLTTATLWSASPPSLAGVARASALCLAMLAGDPFTRALGVAGGIGRAGPLAAAFLVVGGGTPAGFGAMALDLSGAVVVLLTDGVGAIPLGAFLLVRELSGITDAGAPAWWGLVAMLFGTAMAVSCGWLAMRATMLPEIVRNATSGAAGLIVIAVGAAMVARGLDFGAVATWALASALLSALVLTMARATLTVATETVVAGAGTSVVFRLGGMFGRMPVPAFAALIAAAILSLLPPGPGFAAAWLLVQSLLALCRSSGFALPAAIVIVAMAASLGLGLCAAALWRLVAVAMLGQPRTPRAAAAEPSPVASNRALAAFVTAMALAGLLPGLAIRAALPAVAVALGPVAATGLADGVGALGIVTSTETHAYAPLGIVALLGVCGLFVWLVAARPSAGRREAPAWTDGFSLPPWLPFGEPSAQVSAHAFDLRMKLPGYRRPALVLCHVRLSTRQQAASLLGVALLALIAAAFDLLR